MIKLNKKIINYSIISIILAISLFLIGKEPKNIIPTSSLPVSQHIIVLDAGHGQPDRTEQLVKMEFQKNK